MTNRYWDFADSVTYLCHLPLRYDFVLYGSVIENALARASIGIGIPIIRVACAGDMEDIADKSAQYGLFWFPDLVVGPAGGCVLRHNVHECLNRVDLPTVDLECLE
jgi:hypothetical protein